MGRALFYLALLAQTVVGIDELSVYFPHMSAVAGTVFSNASLPLLEAILLSPTLGRVRGSNVGGIQAFASVSSPVRNAIPLSGAAEVSSTFANGIATFPSLRIDLVGTWKLAFRVPPQSALRSELSVVGNGSITILPGPATALRIDTQPGRATGGVPFAAQPALSLVDAVCVLGVNPGDCNLVPLDDVPVTVTVLARPAGLTATTAPLLPLATSSHTVRTKGGRAVFTGLAFNPAGDGYVLRFSATLPTPLPPTSGAAGAVLVADSRPLTVGVGPTASLALAQQPLGARAGHAFATQPVIELRDAGGNLCVDDSSSSVTVSVYDRDRSPLSQAGIASRARLYTGRREAGLGPQYLRWLYPFPTVQARVAALPSQYVELNVDPTELGLASAPTLTLRPLIPLQGGDRIALGGPASGWLQSDTAGSTSMQLLVDAGEGAVEEGSVPPTSPYPPYPALGLDGLVLQLLRAAPENRLRLNATYPGPATPAAAWVRLSKVESALTRPVRAGVATFHGLRLAAVGDRFRLLFTSSLLNVSQSVAAGALDPVSGAWAGANSRKAPAGRGTGVVGYGFGYGARPEWVGVVPRRISLLSQPFSVEPGDPVQLVVVRPAGRAWAGGSPFGVQPIVAVADAGGNVLRDRYRDTLTLTLADPADLGGTGYSSQFLTDCGALLREGGVGGNRTLEGGAGLVGTLSMRVWAGVGEWWDVGIRRPSLAGGKQFVLVYSTTLPSGTVLRACQPLYVAASAEYSLLPFTDPSASAGDGTPLPTLEGNGGNRSYGEDRGLRGAPAPADRYGHAVAVTEDVAIVGAPLTDEPTPEVQVVQLIGGAPGQGSWQGEVQTVTLSAVWRPSIQTVRLVGVQNASAYGVPRGNFTLSWRYSAGDTPLTRARTTRPIPSTITAAGLAAVLEEDLLHQVGDVHEATPWGRTGRVDVSRILQEGGLEVLQEGETEGGLDDVGRPGVWQRTWRVTFTNIYGDVPLMTGDGSGLVGARPANATFPSPVELVMEQVSTRLGGSFRLALPQPLHAAATRQLADHGAGEEPLPAFNSSAPCPSSACLTTTGPLPWDIDANSLARVLERVLHSGPVGVDIRNHTFADGYIGGQAVGARVMTITFTPRPGSADVPTLQPDAGNLTGFGAHIAVRTRQPGLEPLGGSFTLTVRGVRSPPISVQATAADVRAALLATGVVIDASVSRSEAPSLAADLGGQPWWPDEGQDGPVEAPILGPSFTITFLQLAEDKDAFDDAAAVPGVEGGLQGEVEAPLLVWDRLYTPLVDPAAGSSGTNRSDGALPGTLRPLGGSWTLCKLPGGALGWPGTFTGAGWWDGADPSASFPALPRVDCEGAGVNETTGGIPPGILTGTEAGIEILRAGDSMGQQPWEDVGARAGGRGSDTGAAYAYARVLGGTEWDRVAKLRATDGEPTALFGHAVSVDAAPGWEAVLASGSTSELHAAAAVGAPGARLHGVLEVQQLQCIAAGGSFVLLFRGHRTNMLSSSATAAQVETALNSLPAAIRVRVAIPGSTLPSDPVCTPGPAGTASTVTFLWPRDGDLPALIADATRLSGAAASITVRELVAGTAVSSGANATGAAGGSVYIFEPAPPPGNAVGVRGPWAQTARIDPPSPVLQGGVGPRSLFGWSVALTVAGAGGAVHTLAVGAPGHEEDGGLEAGAVHVFQRSATGLYGSSDWALVQTLFATNPNGNSVGGAGFRFGWSVSFSEEGDTLAVGAPAGPGAVANDGSTFGQHGAVYVFKREPRADAWFFIDQSFEPAPPSIHSSWSPATHAHYGFGTSLSFGRNALVVGAPYAMAPTGANRGQASGCVWVYDRLGWGTAPQAGFLTHRSTVCPESAREGDRIGLTVAAADHVAVIGGVAQFLGVEDSAAAGGSMGDSPLPSLVHPGAGAAGWPSGGPRHEVQLVYMHTGSREELGEEQAGGPHWHVGGTFTLQWRGVQSRRLPWNAPSSLLRAVLQNELGTGRVRVTRSGPSTHTLAFQWRVTFLDAALLAARDEAAAGGRGSDRAAAGLRPLPLLRARSWLVYERGDGMTPELASADTTVAMVLSEPRYLLDSPHFTSAPFQSVASPSPSVPVHTVRPQVRVLRLSTPSPPVRGGVYVLAREHGAGQAGYTEQWYVTASLSPHAWQGSDQFGAAVGVSRSGRHALVGAPSRDNPYAQGPAGKTTGGSFLFSLLPLNAQFLPQAVFDRDDMGTVSTRLPEHDAAALTAAGPGADSVSRGAHAGLGIASGRVLTSLRVCSPTCLVPPYPVDASIPLTSPLYGPSVLTPQPSLALGQLTLYASTADGDDWGPYSALSGSRAPPEGEVAAFAHSYPATSIAAGDGSGWLGQGMERGWYGGRKGAQDENGRLKQTQTGWGWGPEPSSYELNALASDGSSPFSSPSSYRMYRQAGLGGLTPVSRSSDPSACSDASAGQAECSFLRGVPLGLIGPRPILSSYDESGVQDYVPFTRILRLELSRGQDGVTAAPYTTGAGSQVLAGGVRHALPFVQRVSVTVADDGIAEERDEMLHLRLWLPGIQPTWGGRQWLPILLQDDGDGQVGSQGYYQSLPAAPSHAQSPMPPLPPGGTYDGYQLGFSLALDSTGTMAVIGAPGASPAGRVRFLRYTLGVWSTVGDVGAPVGVTASPTLHVLSPGGPTVHPRFGEGVALWSNGGTGIQEVLWAAVGSAPAAIVTLYRWDGATGVWSEYGSPLVPDMHSAGVVANLLYGRETARPVSTSDGCGGKDRLAFLTESVGSSPSTPLPVLAVGCPGVEAVFLFRTSGLADSWSQTAVLRASDYALYYPGGLRNVLPLSVPAGFGSSVSASGSTLAIGAPRAGGVSPLPAGAEGRPVGQREQADYEDERDSTGPGQVYIFHMLQGVRLSQFSAEHVPWADLAAWPAADEALAAAPSLQLPVLDDANVAALQPIIWAQQVMLAPPGSSSLPGSGFGSALSLDGRTLAVGAPRSAGGSGGRDAGRTTWDFESGDLRGWTVVGDAFAHQPVFGDNSAARPGYPTRLGASPPASSRPKGRFHVNSYEGRPADFSAGHDAAARRSGHSGAEVSTGELLQWAVSGVTHVTTDMNTSATPARPAAGRSSLSAPSTPAGTVQGDGPTGSMTSVPFLIAGSTVTFLLGGGCDERLLYIELVVEGAPSALKATGACTQDMRRIAWDVSPFLGRVGALRVVDASSASPWGHIAVDEIAFDWAVGQGVDAGATGLVHVYRMVRPVGAGQGPVGTGHTRTSSEPRLSSTLPHAVPAASSLGRSLPHALAPCPPSQAPLSCLWSLEQTLRPSDGSSGWAFGSAVAVSEASALLVVGAPAAQAPLSSWSPSTAASPRGAADTGAVAYASSYGQGDVSARADGGLNSGTWGYGWGSVWGRRMPWDEGAGAHASSVGVSEEEAELEAAMDASGASAFLPLGSSASSLSPRLTSLGRDRGRGGPQGTLHGLTPRPPLPVLPGSGLSSRQRQTARTNPFAAAPLSRGPGAVYVYRAEPDKVSGAGQSHTLLRPRLWSATGWEHSVLDAPSLHVSTGEARTSSEVGLGWSVGIAGFRALAGAPGAYNGAVQAGGPTVPESTAAAATKIVPRAGTAVHVDLSYTFLSFDPADHTTSRTLVGAGAAGAHFNQRTGTYTQGGTSTRWVQHYTTSEAAGPKFNNGARPEVVLPVYRSGIHPSAGTAAAGVLGSHPPGSPQALLAPATLHIAFATGDGTARGVSDAKYRSCMQLLPPARGPASCGDYASQAGLITFGPLTRRQDIVLLLTDDACPEPDTEHFTVRLYLPGGVRIRGHGYSATIRIDDDDDAWAGAQAAGNRSSAWLQRDVDRAALDATWQPERGRASLCAPEDVPLGQHANQHLPPLP